MIAHQVQTITGRFEKLLPPDEEAMEGMTIRVVAHRDERGEWCAVFGAVEPDATDQDVYDYGYKLPRETAQILFPNISGRYRE